MRLFPGSSEVFFVKHLLMTYLKSTGIINCCQLVEDAIAWFCRAFMFAPTANTYYVDALRRLLQIASFCSPLLCVSGAPTGSATAITSIRSFPY